MIKSDVSRYQHLMEWHVLDSGLVDFLEKGCIASN